MAITIVYCAHSGCDHIHVIAPGLTLKGFGVRHSLLGQDGKIIVHEGQLYLRLPDEEWKSGADYFEDLKTRYPKTAHIHELTS
jgi:hypothetical protein